MWLVNELSNLFSTLIDSQAVETERYRSELAKVRAELEPWEKQIIEHKGKLEVACTENKLLIEKVMLIFYIRTFKESWYAARAKLLPLIYIYIFYLVLFCFHLF